MAVDGPTGDGRPFAVKNCYFRGGQLALDLNHTEVASEDCTFEGVRDLAVWSHDSEGIWNPLATIEEDDPFGTTNFRDCWNMFYLRTELCEIHYHEHGRDDSELEVYVNTALTEPFAIHEPLQTMLWSFEGNRVNVLRPHFLTGMSTLYKSADSAILRFDAIDPRSLA